MSYHKSVLLHEIIAFLNPQKGDLFIDATAGGGGHSEELAKRGARVLAIDRDQEAVDYLNSKNLTGLTVKRGNFAKLAEVAKEAGFKKAKGILFDLGVSSHQVDEARRGFSFQKEGPLDMRMDTDLTVRAYDIVNNFEERRLNEILKTYGQEKFSRAISKAVCSARQIKPIETTLELAQIIKNAVPKSFRGVRKSRIHEATRTFQALRIVINSELLNLQDALPQTVETLDIGGRLAIISFHSLEDGIVKRFLKQEGKLKVLTPKPIGPSNEEIEQNPRARSAKLRVAEKI
ncbi:MAG TPA: 16S rRNA (cytosine(1402)-N(4))-methyltransferase RsmH [Candidatus Saccharimonadales bacterium]|nr:16S rRNA (cytosine(1402)-N(4))-methyltransferase RsmH [Candidatus Saccharimonadales bacterium]